MPILFYVFLAILATTTLVAVVFGGRDERVAALAIFSAALLTPLLKSHSYSEPETGILLVDTLLFIVLALIAMRSSAFWPIWAAGFQLCGLAVHFAAAKLPTMLPAIYAQTLAIWTFPVLIAVMAGTWLEARARHVRG